MKEQKKKQCNVLPVIMITISGISLILSILNLCSFIYLHDLHQKTTITSSKNEIMLLDRIRCLEGEKDACENEKKDNL